MNNKKPKRMRYKNFTGSVFSFGRMFLLLLLVASIYACNKNAALGPPSSLTEMTGRIEFINVDTAITLTWDKAHTAWQGDYVPDVHYEVQVSLDETFTDPIKLAYSGVVDSAYLFLNEEHIIPLDTYYARVRAYAGTSTARSGWISSPSFFILDELPEINLFRTVKVWELTDNAVVLNWEPNDELTRLVVSSGDEDNDRIVNLSSGSEPSIQLEGLSSSQDYSATLFAGDRSMGALTFTTKSSVDGMGYVDLRTSEDPSILASTLNTVPSGSTIVLRRGMTYAIEGNFRLDRDVTIMSEPGFGAQARITMTSSFDVAEAATIALVKFEDVEITGNIESTYVFNLSPASNVGAIEIEACRINNHRGAVRMKDNNQKNVGTFILNNSIVKDIGGYGVINVDNTLASLEDIRISNSTIINANRLVVSKSNSRSITLENLTLYQSPGSGQYVIDYNGPSITSGVTISNVLFGPASSSRSLRGGGSPSISVENSYATSDFGGDLINGVGLHSAGAAQVFVAPNNGDFTVQVEDLQGTGDLRWRP